MRFATQHLDWALLLVLSASLSCAEPLTRLKEIEIPAAAENRDARRIVVVKSSENPIFTPVVETFVGQTNHQVVIATINPKAGDARIAEALGEQKPDLFFTLGTRAALVIRDHFPDTPMVFAMAPAWKAYGLGRRSNAAGITMQSPASFDFMQFKMALPDLDKVLVLYNPTYTSAFVKEARREIQNFGIELQIVPVGSAAQIAKAYARSDKSFDAVWLHSDPTVIQKSAFETLKALVEKDRKVIISSVSDKFAHSGALASVSLDFPGLGSQAAILCDRLLAEGSLPEEERAQAPIGGNLTVNLATAREAGLSIPRDAFQFINKIIVDEADLGGIARAEKQ